MLHRLGWFLIWVGLLSTILAWVLAAPPMCVRYGIGVIVVAAFVTYWTRWMPPTELAKWKALCARQQAMLEAAAVAAGVHKPAFTPTAGFDMTGRAYPISPTASVSNITVNGASARLEQSADGTVWHPLPMDTQSTMPHVRIVGANGDAANLIPVSQHVRHTPQPEQSGAFMPHMPTIDALTASVRGQQEVMDTIAAETAAGIVGLQRKYMGQPTPEQEVALRQLSDDLVATAKRENEAITKSFDAMRAKISDAETKA